MDEIYAIIPVSKFLNAKTRLSPFLKLKERENLLKTMLKDVTTVLSPLVNKIIIISSDKYVLEYAKKLNVATLVENEGSNLNNALIQAMDWCIKKTKKVIIIPSDIPLITKTNLQSLINSSKNIDCIIIPSKGGGTNGLIIKPLAINMHFGNFSFIKHIKEAENKRLSPLVYDSFYMSLDVNTIEDLGEIILHGQGTGTQKYLKSLNISVKANHGPKRLKISRKKT